MTQQQESVSTISIPSTSRERFRAALERRSPPGRVPTFELGMFLTMEVFGRIFPWHRNYSQWRQMTESERRLHRRDLASLDVEIVRRFEHDAIRFVPPVGAEEERRILDMVLEMDAGEHFLLIEGDATLAIPSGDDMVEVSMRMAEDPEGLDDELKRRVDRQLERVERLVAGGGVDGVTLCSDYCFNAGTFLPLHWFDRFIMPHLTRQVEAYRQMGLRIIKHTDGNIMPILDRLVESGVDALHSLDPQGGVDMAEIVRRVGDRVALCGNVNCGLLQTGTDEECIASARYALHEGMKAPGYIFCTSNCVFTGMELRRYELILDVWKREGIRPGECRA